METSTYGQPAAAGGQDYQQYDRIWQRVSPELNPYPEVRAESAGTAGQSGGAPALRQAGAPEDRPETGLGPCCMGTAAQQSLQVLQGFLDWEWRQRCVYLAQAGLQRRGDRAALLRRMAARSRLHVRKLMAACYLITGQCCQPAAQTVQPQESGWAQLLREFYHEESCDSINYRRAAEETTDLCLAALFRELGEESQTQAVALFRELTRLMGGAGG